MTRLSLIFTTVTLALTALTVLGQTKTDTTKTNYCNWTGCTLKSEDPAHFDPYYNGHLCENFNPAQTDFSNEYLKLRTAFHKDVPEIIGQLKKYNCNLVWLRTNSQDGVIGINYKRIKIKILTATQDKNNPLIYHITGKSKVKDNICDFKGIITILKAYQYKESEIPKARQGTLFAQYIFNEQTNQTHSGKFKGIVESSFLIDSTTNKIQLDTTAEIADGYFNNSFVGVWKDYKTNQEKKCIWGEYRLPFTFDFDSGDGEMHINDKYKKNGWETFNQPDVEYTFIKDGFSVEKNQWWTSSQQK